MNINDRLYNELFCKKTVKYNQSAYNRYYRRIWKDELLYKDFLQSSSEEIQKKAAKEIVSRLLYGTVFPIPEFLFESLMKSEYKDIANNKRQFQGQVHSVHSVMLYILGVWMFFNHPIFNKHLINYFGYKRPKNQFEAIEDTAIKSFITTWKAFSLCHDVGYVFENSIDKNANLVVNSYNSLFGCYNKMDFISYYELTMKSLSKLIFIQNVINFSNDNIKDFIGLFSATEKVIGEELNPIIENDDYIQLKNINSYEQLKVFLPYIDVDAIIIVIRDKKHNIVSVSQGNKHYYINDLYTDVLKNINTLFFGCEEYSYNEFYTEYYVKDLKNTIKNYHDKLDLRPYYRYFKEVSDYIGSIFQFHFLKSNNYIDDETTQYRIYNYLKQEVPIDRFKKALKEGSLEYKIDDKKESKETIINIVSDLLSKYEYHDSDLNLTEDMYKYILSKISEEEFYNSVVKSIVNKTNMERNVSFLNTIFLYVSQDYPKNSHKYVSISNAKKRKVKYEFFNNHNVFSSRYSNYREDELKKIIEYITKQTINYGLGNEDDVLDNIIKYHPEHSFYDHGIVSASLLAQSFVTYKELYKNSNSEKKFIFPLQKALRYQNPNALDKNDNCYYDAILSILLHNIYPKQYKQLFNISFKQSLFTNPFCYFSAFCDTLQRWDRPKTINYAEKMLKGDYITGKNYDLRIVNDYVVIESISSRIDDSIYSNKYSLDEFLENGSELIKLNISENES